MSISYVSVMSVCHVGHYVTVTSSNNIPYLILVGFIPQRKTTCVVEILVHSGHSIGLTCSLTCISLICIYIYNHICMHTILNNKR